MPPSFPYPHEYLNKTSPITYTQVYISNSKHHRGLDLLQTTWQPKCRQRSFPSYLDLTVLKLFSIVFGSLGGKLESAFGKLATLHAKNNFSFAIVAGNLFESSEEADSILTRLLNGEIKVPLPTYFTVGTTPLPPQVIERIEKDEDVSCDSQQLSAIQHFTHASDRFVRTCIILASAASTRHPMAFVLSHWEAPWIPA